MLKKIVKIFAVTLIVLFVAALAAPFLFKGKIIAFAKKEINQQLNANVDFTDIDLSLFRHFPKLAAGIQHLQVIGRDEFSKDTLFSAKNIDVTLNLMSILGGSNFKIYNISIEEPRIHAIISKEGIANWNITKPDSSNTANAGSKPFQLKLDAYSIHNGYLNYQDFAGNMQAEIINLNHSGSGNFSADLFTLATKTSADAVSFTYGNIPYFYHTKTTMDADLQVDNTNRKYSFTTDKIMLNNLPLQAEGFFQFMNDSVYNMDIRFKSPSSEFKNILSLVPVIYQHDFAKIKTSGSAVFNGFVKGIYGNAKMPAYNLNLGVKDGFFQYPDLPKPVKQINLALTINNPDGITDHTVVDVTQAHLELDNDPFDFRILVKTPVSDMFIEAAAKGKLDLAGVSKLVKLEPGTKLSGLLAADIRAIGNLSAIEHQQYDKFNASGTIVINDFLYASRAYPDGVQVKNLQAGFTPKNLSITNVSGQYLKTNYTANGSMDNLLPYVLKNKTLTGTINLKADKLNLNDWMGNTADTNTSSNASSKPFAVPANLNLTIHAGIDNVQYDKVDIQNLNGTLLVKDETVALNNVSANALDGTMLINGTYSTRESKTKPDISFTYDVKRLDVQKTFNAFNTVQKLMPIGKFIEGKLSSQLVMKGKLGDNLMPDLASLTGNGNLLLLEGFLNKFAPLEKIATTLNIKELQSISVKDIKNSIEFANGKVLVKPFHVKLKDVDMEIGGMHGFDQSIDYLINMKLPRSLLGDQGNALVNRLADQINSKGIPVKLSDMINLKLKMGGTLSNPSLKTDLKEAGGSLTDDLKKQATDFAKAKIDSTKSALTHAIKDTVASLKTQALQDAGNALKKQLLGKADSSNTNGNKDAAQKATEAAKGILDNFNPFKKKKPAADTIKH